MTRQDRPSRSGAAAHAHSQQRSAGEHLERPAEQNRAQRQRARVQLDPLDSLERRLVSAQQIVHSSLVRRQLADELRALRNLRRLIAEISCHSCGAAVELTHDGRAWCTSCAELYVTRRSVSGTYRVDG